ncbi:MAG: hypothetical protein Q8M37_00980 [Nevskia sp.]|nr:hypothetical protein [Nevskia sp.]
MNSLSDSGGRADRGLGFELGRCVGRTDAGAAVLPVFGPPGREPGRAAGRESDRKSARPADFEAGLYDLPAGAPGRDVAGLDGRSDPSGRERSAGRSADEERGFGREAGRVEDEGGALRFKAISATRNKADTGLAKK